MTVKERWQKSKRLLNRAVRTIEALVQSSRDREDIEKWAHEWRIDIQWRPEGWAAGTTTGPFYVSQEKTWHEAVYHLRRRINLDGYRDFMSFCACTKNK
jgi:hypothetical protein